MIVLIAPQREYVSLFVSLLRVFAALREQKNLTQRRKAAKGFEAVLPC